MSTNTHVVTVFKVIQQGRLEDRTMYIKHIGSASSATSQTWDIAEAHKVDDMSISQIVDAMSLFEKTLNSDVRIELVKITTVTTMEDVDTSDEVFMEVRRKKALEKLTLSEINALGLEKLATYSKLKYYKTDEND